MTNEKSDIQENLKQLERDIAHLREWLTKQPHIHGRTDDKFLLTFLRGCKYSLERAKEKIDTFYTMMTLLPEFFSNRDTMDPIAQEVFRLGCAMPMGTDEQGRRITLLRAGQFDPTRVPTIVVAKLDLMNLQALLEEDGIETARGLVLVVDMQGMTLAQAAHITPAIIKKTLMVLQNAFPIRPQAIHLINMASMLQTFIQLVLSFLKEKLKRRITIHENLETLHDAIPKKNLPEEYGGSAGPIQRMIDERHHKMNALRDYFLKEDQYGVDESKRPGKPVSHEDLFGFEGSFRQLKVD